MAAKKNNSVPATVETSQPAPQPSSSIAMIDIGKLTPNPDQPRKHFDSIAMRDLALSIKGIGIINPITASEGNDGIKTIIAGERRFRAAQEAGLSEVPCIIMDTGNALEIALAENMHREGLTAIEEAEALQKFVEQGLTQKELSIKTAKSKSYISELIAIAGLPDFIKDQCRNEPKYARRELKKIAAAKPEVQVEMFEIYKKKLASLVRLPNKTERQATSCLKTAIKSLETQLVGFAKIDDELEKEAISDELRILGDKIKSLLGEVRHVELKETKPTKAKLIRRSKQTAE
jgi:ParB family chromosome partitioning protein